MKTVCLYFQVHQPWRLKKYRFFNMGKDHNYLDDLMNRSIMQKVARQCYLPMNALLLKLIRENKGKFRCSFSITGIAIEQFRAFAPEVLDSFKELAATGCVEFLAETYSHSLASLASKEDFTEQVKLHTNLIKKEFGVKPTAFRNTELIYSDEIGAMVAGMGFRTMLAEGAQGSMLDIDFGTYPFVTSSNTLCAGVCTGLGVAATRIGSVYGIFRAYCTRVGSGPFPTELFDEDGERMRQIGMEFGATTGRPRRCGWLDMVALKYSVMMNGVTSLIMMKADVLNDFDRLKVAVAYRVNGERTTEFPFETAGEIVPEYREFEGWKCDINSMRSYDEFPRQLKEYIEFIERETGVPVKIISVGPDREETIVR